MTGVIQITDHLLAFVDNLMVANAAGIGKGHCAALWILDDVFDADEQILDFSRLLTDCLRKDNADAIGIGSLRASYHSHVGTIGATTCDHLIPGEHERITQHLDKLLVRQRQIPRSYDGNFSGTRLLNKKQLLCQLIHCRDRDSAGHWWF